MSGKQASGHDLDGAYSGGNVREPVLFAQAMEELKNEGIDAVVEIGPHPVLTPLMAECLDSGRRTPLILPTLRRGEGMETLLRSAAMLETRGFDLDWASLTPPGRFTSFPTYPWQRERYWLDDGLLMDPGQSHAGGDNGRAGSPDHGIVPSEPRAIGASDAPLPQGERPSLADALERQESDPRNVADVRGHWLILADQGGKALALATQIRSRGGTCTVAGPIATGNGSASPAEALLPGPMNVLEDGIRVSPGATPVRGVISLQALDFARRPAGSLSAIEQGHRDLLGGTLRIVQALASSPDKPGPRLWIVTRGAQSIGQDLEPPCLLQAPLWGLGRSIASEAPELWGGLIDLDPAAPEPEIADLAEVIGTAGSEEQVAFRELIAVRSAPGPMRARRLRRPGSASPPGRDLSDHRRARRARPSRGTVPGRSGSAQAGADEPERAS